MSYLDLMLSFAFADQSFNAHFPFHFSPCSVVEIFWINTKTSATPFFPISAHLSSASIRQSISRLQTELVLKLVGVNYISTILKLDRVVFDLRKRNRDNGSRTRRRQLLDRFNVFSGISLRFESVSEVAPLERNEERHKERDGRMPAPLRRHRRLH